MTRVFVLGQPYWGARIASALEAPDVRATFVGPRGYLNLVNHVRSRGSRDIVLIRAGYRVGAPTIRGRLFDDYWRVLRTAARKAIFCHYWLGTDALNTLEDARAGRLRMRHVVAAAADLHVADAPWLVEEVRTVGFSAVVVPVPQRYHAPEVVPPLPADFSVLTYVPDARFAFYGGQVVLDAARQMPEVSFDIVGGTGSGISSPGNVTWHGWVTDMQARYAAATVVVRVPRHDGLGASVIEGLLNARHIVYSYPLPHTVRVDPASSPALVEALGALAADATADRLMPNLDGREYALEAFDYERLRQNLRQVVVER